LKEYLDLLLTIAGEEEKTQACGSQDKEKRTN
jgi:hypothetical protein